MTAMLPINSERHTFLKLRMFKHREKAKMWKQLEINALTRKKRSGYDDNTIKNILYYYYMMNHLIRLSSS